MKKRIVYRAERRNTVRRMIAEARKAGNVLLPSWPVAWQREQVLEAGGKTHYAGIHLMVGDGFRDGKPVPYWRWVASKLWRRRPSGGAAEVLRRWGRMLGKRPDGSARLNDLLRAFMLSGNTDFARAMLGRG